jgi:filamentous hemagglutinin family protein
MARSRSRITLLLLAGTAIAGSSPALAQTLPTGPSVAHGGVVVTTSGHAMTINQSTHSAIVNWQSFSIGASARVDINQPSASAAILNRVTGSATSTIAGQLNANGRVYLVNPNGITITETGVIRAGSFVASTLGITDEDFIAGRRQFTGKGKSAAVVNRGAIEIGSGGYAALLGGQVDNSGVVSVPLGKVGFGAGEAATLDLSGDGFLQVTVPSTNGQDKELIRHSGRITADGGRVEMRAATARDAARNAINLSGIVEARTVSGRSGAIVLGGGAGGRVTVSGRLDASGRHAGQGGGAIAVQGKDVRLAGATLDASGAAGGGTVRVGGDVQGGGDLQRAETTSVDAATTIAADATEQGNGGNVVIWSDLQTTFAGHITARGGEAGGDGGFAEVSGGQLSYTGLTDLSAVRGAFGTLLLDPYNVFISTGPTTPEASTAGGFTANQNDTVINNQDLASALQTANVTVSTGGSGSPGTQPGDIFVQAPVSWTAATTLTLNANRDIAIQSPITAQNGGLTLTAGRATTATAAVDVGTFRLTAGNWAQNAPAVPAFMARDFRLEGSSIFLRATGGSGTTADPFRIADVYGLQGMATSPTASAVAGVPFHFALANDIDASGTRNWNGGAGFRPIGTFGTPFTGSLDGSDHEISGLYINRPTESFVGLFGYAQNATFRNLGLTNLSVTGGSEVGGLIGEQKASGGTATINRVAVNGIVNGSGSFIGGLAGRVVAFGGGTSIIDFAGSQAAVNAGAGSLYVGGLVGANDSAAADAVARITRSAAVGIVTAGEGSSFVGGLAGENWSFAGLSTISQSFALGDVQAAGATNVGGLVGGNNPINADAAVEISQSYTVGQVTGDTNVGGLVGANFGPGTARIMESYAAGPVTGSTNVGGLVGFADPTTQTTTSYWDRQTTGQQTSAGGQSRSTAELVARLPDGFDPAVWGINPGQSYPFLFWAFPLGVVAPVVVPEAREPSAAPPAILAPPPILPPPPIFTTELQPTLAMIIEPLTGTLDLSGPGIAPTPAGQLRNAQATLAFVERASADLERRMAACEARYAGNLAGFTTCAGDALTQYAQTLESRLLELPPPLRRVTAVIREAAARVRVARTIEAARRAVRTAVVEVRRAIALIRADEPQLARVQTQQGQTIASALASVENRLDRAVGL